MNQGVAAYASGGNYSITIEHAVAVCRVVRRMDVTREVGAGFAREKIAIFRRLAQEPTQFVSGVVLDLVDAPTTWGPLTHTALVTMLVIINEVSRPIAIVVADDFSQKVQVASVLADAHVAACRVFAKRVEAIDWVRTRH